MLPSLCHGSGERIPEQETIAGTVLCPGVTPHGTALPQNPTETPKSALLPQAAPAQLGKGAVTPRMCQQGMGIQEREIQE